MKASKKPSSKTFEIVPTRVGGGNVGVLMDILEQWDTLKGKYGGGSPSIEGVDYSDSYDPSTGDREAKAKVTLGLGERTMPMMEADQSSRYGQRQMGQYYWDPYLRKWQIRK
jgi:hypothetical protein